jgi:hypothetical protein
VDPTLHVLDVLERGELGRDHAEHDGLVRGQVLERLERARTLGVILKVKHVHVDLVEELLGDAIVPACGDCQS